MTIELRLIRYALALGEHGNYARAAEALKITQPSLSRSIASLEAQLGVPLFDRGPKGRRTHRIRPRADRLRRCRDATRGASAA